MMVPTETISPGRLEGRKKQKQRLTLLAYANADGTENFPMPTIERAKIPR